MRTSANGAANRNGHGHNYTLEVTVSGEVDPTLRLRSRSQRAKRTSFEREVVSVYDHRHLSTPKSPELSMATQHAKPILYHRKTSATGYLALPSTERSSPQSSIASASTRCPISSPTTTGEGADHMTARLSRRYHFSASQPPLHRSSTTMQKNREVGLRQRNNPHGYGHNYTVKGTSAGRSIPPPAWSPTSPISDAFAQSNLLDRFDHQNLQ